MTDITPAEKDGKYEFTISYSERELLCEVEKEQNILHVTIDKTLHADLKVNSDGSVEQTEGVPIPASTVEYIKKRVIG
ncbi:hypothetical protein LJ707_17160 [Mucilaginibacter sp. UR6-1]|uniref:hypothetical protein n=1 Tax=Mucilaginibacter sp. UR6-1 TaxID=1435643 RepID=UPI001E393E48|nr:hypothetical protein [Mucilaginibacter sp. UR6-1]MCC8410674.1 hypothetical protein [Mucilaginibacter sp. UR6-1]